MKLRVAAKVEGRPGYRASTVRRAVRRIDRASRRVVLKVRP